MKKTKIIFAVFVLVTAIDFFASFLVKLKQPHFNEGNILYLLTGKFWLLGVWKLFAVAIFYLLLIKYYKKVPIYLRYMAVAYLFVAVLSQSFGIIHAVQEYSKQPEEVRYIPVERRQEIQSSRSAPVMYMYLTIFFIFLLWRAVEVEQLEYSKKD